MTGSREAARMADDREYAMVAVKRDWVPEWLWWLLSRPFGSSWAPALWVWPLREVLTRKAGGRS